MTKAIGFPFKIGANGDIHTSSGDDLIKDKIKQAIMTKGFVDGIIGELPWNSKFGSGIYIIRHENASLGEIKVRLNYHLSKILKEEVPEVLKFKYDITETTHDGAKALRISIGYKTEEGENKVDLIIQT